jgi:hypothetical protein
VLGQNLPLPPNQPGLDVDRPIILDPGLPKRLSLCLDRRPTAGRQDETDEHSNSVPKLERIVAKAVLA